MMYTAIPRIFFRFSCHLSLNFQASNKCFGFAPFCNTPGLTQVYSQNFCRRNFRSEIRLLNSSVPKAKLQHIDLFPFKKRKQSSTFSTGTKILPQSLPHLDQFNLVCNGIIDDLTVNNKCIPPLVAERLRQVLNYNILGGKKNRGLTVVLAYDKFSLSTYDPSDNNIKLASILGWCVELLQGFFLVADDIMDNSQMRRGQPCWFRVEGIGLEAVNDAILLESCIYEILKLHFSELKCYSKLVNEFHEITKRTLYGQCLDMTLSSGESFVDKFSLQYYKSLVELKTAYYTYVLPIYLAMHLVGGFDADQFAAVHNICLKLGYLFQMQDDYLDAYGNAAITGKLGGDIKEGKCTWFAASALETSSVDGKNLMKKYYGIDDDTAVKTVLEHYDTLSLKKRYYEMEENITSEIQTLITKLDENMINKELFQILLNNIYKRKK